MSGAGGGGAGGSGLPDPLLWLPPGQAGTPWPCPPAPLSRGRWRGRCQSGDDRASGLGLKKG